MRFRGTITALKKGMDLFGVVILGLTTAVGGGVLRHSSWVITPPATFRSPGRRSGGHCGVDDHVLSIWKARVGNPAYL